MAARSYDLVIVGAGSGNMLRAGEFAGWRIAVVEASRFGGTCLNRGCIPSKMLVHTADVAQAVRHAAVSGSAPRGPEPAGRPSATGSSAASIRCTSGPRARLRILGAVSEQELLAQQGSFCLVVGEVVG